MTARTREIETVRKQASVCVSSISDARCFFSWSSLTSWIIQDRGSTSTDRRRPVKQLLLRQSVFPAPVFLTFEVGKYYDDYCVAVQFSVAGWWIIFNIEAPLTNMNNKYWQRVMMMMMMMINVTWVFLLQSNGTRGRGVPASKLQHSVKLFNMVAW